MLKHLWILLALVISSCTVQEVTDFATKNGVNITVAEAEAISSFLTTQDCLPNYDESQLVECAIKDAANRYNVNVDRMARIANCESGFDPKIKNRRSSALGLFQFLTSTWVWIQDAGAPYAHLDRTHARANAFTAAWLMARPSLGGFGHWVCR